MVCFFPHVFVSFAFAVALLPAFASAKRVKGTLNSEEDWDFLARFCYVSEGGSLKYNVTYRMDFCCQTLLLYFDSPYQWPAAYDSHLNCTERVALLNFGRNQKIYLHVSGRHSGCFMEIHNLDYYLRCVGTRMFTSARDRWWYVALSRCGSRNGLRLDYDLHFTNPGNFWKEEFSADEQGILETDITFSIFLFVIMCFSFVSGRILAEQGMLHTTYKLFLVSVILQEIGFLSLTLHYGIYGNDGMGVKQIKVIGRLVSAASEIVFLLTLLLLGKGWTVVRGRLTYQSQFRLTLMMSIYTIMYAGMFIWEAVAFDPAKVLYTYDSPAGYGFVALSIMAFCWFTYIVMTTVKHYPDKKLFYIPFYFFYSMWFLARPVLVLISNHHIQDYSREKVVNGVSAAITFFGYLIFLILTRPTAANTNFPFHIRTAQVDIVRDDDDDDESHPYAPSSYVGKASPGFQELFSASRSPENRVSSDNIATSGRPRRQVFTSTSRNTDPNSSGQSLSNDRPIPMQLFSASSPAPPPAYDEVSTT
ncbi:transmembrane protein 145-like [Corticium candelabrum]|uniref:transmembrane protein 145-like n=1 Tax=Corticium candelabrum TaxID=121492 RepID=UPI002E25DE99|nr:transmembrane protein 145-like [Corticium candelabrum]